MKNQRNALDAFLLSIPQSGFAVLTMIAASSIIWMGLRPASQLTGMAMLPENSDKILHAFAYGSMTACGFRTVYPWSPKRRPIIPNGWILALAFTACVGGLDEFLQGWVQRGRSQDIHDWMADVTGGTLVCVLGLICRARSKNSR